jgi:hypothetical protein
MADVSGESGFEVDGERLEIPTLDTITLDEERVLYIYADVVLSDFLPTHPDWTPAEQEAHLLLQAGKIRNPDFKRALVHIAYKRAHPETPNDEIDVRVGNAGALELDLEIIAGAARRSDPQTRSPNERDKTSATSTLERNGDSGTPTGTSSGTPEDDLETIGISGSDTSSPESLPTGSES